MAASQQIQLRNQVATLVAAVLTLDGGLHKNRDFNLGTGKLAQLHVNLRSSTPVDELVFAGHPRDWDTEIELVFLARKVGDDGSGAVEAGDAADALWVQAYAAVMADNTLGGLATDVTPGEALVEGAEADTSVCRLTWRLTARHRTDNHTLT